MSKITGYYFGLINSKTCCSTLAPVTKHRMKEVTVVLAQQILMSARPSYNLCMPYKGKVWLTGARDLPNPRKSQPSAKTPYLNSRPCDTTHSNFSLDESTSVVACNNLLNKPPTLCSWEEKIQLINITGLTVQHGSVHNDSADHSRWVLWLRLKFNSRGNYFKPPPQRARRLFGCNKLLTIQFTLNYPNCISCILSV